MIKIGSYEVDFRVDRRTLDIEVKIYTVWGRPNNKQIRLENKFTAKTVKEAEEKALAFIKEKTYVHPEYNKVKNELDSMCEKYAK